MQKLIKLLTFLGSIAEDILILIGLILIIKTTYTLNTIAGTYALGFILLIIGIIMARNTQKK